MVSQIRTRGVTLLESLIATAILALLVSIGVPSFVSLVEDVRRAAMTNSFLADLALARTESIKRGRRVVLCASSDGLACTKDGSWQQGRMVFDDVNNNSERDSDEDILLTDPAGPNDWSIQGNGNVAHYISFHPRGNTRLASGAFQAGTVTVCLRSVENVEATQIIISRSGRPRVERRLLDSCP